MSVVGAEPVDRRGRLCLAVTLVVGATLASLVTALAPVAAQIDTPSAALFARCDPAAPREVALLVGDIDDERREITADFARQLADGPTLSVDLRAVAPGDALDGVVAQLESRASVDDDEDIARCQAVVVVASAVDLGPESICAVAGSRLAEHGAQLWVSSAQVDSGEPRASWGGWPCGDDGVLAESLRATDLARQLAEVAARVRGAGTVVRPVGVCAGDPCEVGRWELTLDPVLGRASFTLGLPDDQSWVQIGLPWGVELRVDRSTGPIGAGSFVLRPTWVTPTVVRLDVELDPSEDDWPGSWAITPVAGTTDEGWAVAAIELGVVPRFVSEPRLVAGRSTTVGVELFDRAGRFVPGERLSPLLTVGARVTDSDGALVAETVLSPNGNGGFVGTLEMPDGDGVDRHTVTAVVEATTNLAAVGSAEVRATAQVMGVEAWPRLVSSEVVVGGDRGGVARGRLAVAAGQGIDACVWLDAATLRFGTEQAAVTLAGNARSASSCATVPSGAEGSLPLEVTLDESIEPGRYEGVVVVGIGSSVDDAYELVELPLVVDVGQPIDTPRRALLTVLLSLVGLGVPLGSVWALDFVKARFRPARQAVVAEIPVAVWPDGSFHRADADAVLLVGNDQFDSAELRRGRRLQAFGLTFAVRNPSSPLRPPIGTVSSPAGPVVASQGVVVDERSILGRVPLHLRDTWIFELDPERTRHAAHDPAAADFQAAYGRLVLLRGSRDADPIDLRGLPRLAKRLALQARSSAGDDSATAQEMLEFVDANVSAPRDLPQARRPSGAPSAELAAPGAGAYEFVGFEGAITFDDFDDFDDDDDDDGDGDERNEGPEVDGVEDEPRPD